MHTRTIRTGTRTYYNHENLKKKMLKTNGQPDAHWLLSVGLDGPLLSLRQGKWFIVS
jgi:hypothetical protein